jgi:hypothetical protein
MYGSLKKNYVALNGIHQSRCYLAVIAAVLLLKHSPLAKYEDFSPFASQIRVFYKCYVFS